MSKNKPAYPENAILETLEARPGTITKNTGGYIIHWPAPALYLLPVGRAALVYGYAGRVGDTAYYRKISEYPIAADGCKLPKKYRDCIAGIENYVRK